ncbi:uncharacterized protein LOC128223293 [Mya arenaria]|uniref:uncharacterized protein LOC128223293 n=1 Tax=Mya arenaria TaxID=6604 RepID=UPI0022E7D7F4|nr:uncharacterized protein LOC128223293 [Mya arenaria]
MGKSIRCKSDIDCSFYETSEDVPDTRELSSDNKNLMIFDDLLLEKQNKCSYELEDVNDHIQLKMRQNGHYDAINDKLYIRLSADPNILNSILTLENNYQTILEKNTLRQLAWYNIWYKISDLAKNDASILNHIVNENVEEFRHWIQEDDIAVVDRGFRDAVQLLKDLGVKTEMPSFLGPKEKQFQTNSANHSRLVTKIRWVVESANGRLKNWKYLDRVIPNSQIPYAGDYTRIVAAICNKYRSPLIASNDEDDLLTAARLISMSRRENLLQARVEEEGLDHLTKSSGWALLSEPGVVPDFPKLDESDLRTLTVGVYQLKACAILRTRAP